MNIFIICACPLHV